MAYIPLIKKTKWIDLSNEHKRLRETVEKDLREGCCENGNIQPIMLQGAFGIGKSTALYYFFHYCWEVLKTPAFFVTLEEVLEKIKEVAASNESLKVENSRLTPIINNMIKSQLELLRSDNWGEVHGVYFPEFKSGDDSVDLSLCDYLEGFEPVIVDFGQGSNPFEGIVFSEGVIREGLASGHTPVLLIDEFESKFYELKKYLAFSGGGILRALFDQIVQSHPFQLIIGNGPASGYEVAKDKGGDDNKDSNTADSRRLNVIPIPFPTTSLLKQKFMDGCPNGYVNFIWWMSRCRPGHIQKLMKEVVYEDFKQYDSSTFVAHTVFRQSIDESGEDVKYLKASYFENIGSHLFSLVKDLLLDFEPCEITMEKEYASALKDYEIAKNFYCCDDLVSVEKVLRPALQDDICKYLSDCQKKEGKYAKISYLTDVNPYFMYILSACTNKNGEMVFNTVCKDEESALADTFLVPLLELTYDFVSQYEDAEDEKTKQVREFLLDCIKYVKYSKSAQDIREDFKKLSDIFDGFKVTKNEEVSIQFSLLALREIIEQPIGSPRLKYKTIDLEVKLNESDFNKSVLLVNDNYIHKIVFIPVLDDSEMEDYLDCLEKYINGSIDELHQNGSKTMRIVYLQQNDKIDEFKERITMSGEEMIPVAKYHKLIFDDFENYGFNFGGPISDFIDSVAKIVIAGCYCGDITSPDGNTIEVKEAINIIKNPEWTTQKEVVRTIEHYEKLVCEGDNSVVKCIEHKSLEDYNSALSKAICDFDDYEDNLPCDFTKVIDATVTDMKSKYIALLYILESAKKKDEPGRVIMDLLKNVGGSGAPLYLKHNDDILEQSLHFDQIKTILLNPETNKDLKIFDIENRFVKNLSAFTETLQPNVIGCSIKDLLSFMDETLPSHWLGSYNEKMSHYGFDSGELFIQLLCLRNYVLSMDFSSLIQQLTAKIETVDKKLVATKVTIAQTVSDINGLLNYSKTKQEELPFSSYNNKLNEITVLLSRCKRVLSEESDSVSVLCIVWSIVSKLENISSSANSFSIQISNIKSSLERAKDKVETIYQSHINLIYEDGLAAKLINLKASTGVGQSFKGYNGNYCWSEFTRLVKRQEETDNVFQKKVNPILEVTLKVDDITNFTSLLNRLLQDTSTYRLRMDGVLKHCSECQAQALEYAKLRNYIGNLLNIENNG